MNFGWAVQGGERELVVDVDDKLLEASSRSIPRADVAEFCVQVRMAWLKATPRALHLRLMPASSAFCRA